MRVHQHPFSIAICQGLRRLKRDQKGLSTVEYMIILALIAVGGITLWKNFGKEVNEKITKSTTAVQGIEVRSQSR